MALGPHLVDGGVLVLPAPLDRRTILQESARVAADVMATPALDAGALLEALEAREDQAPTGTPEGVAFPHAVLPDLPRSVVVAILAGEPVEFGAGRPCDLVFAMFGDARQPWHHVRILARLARITARPEARNRLRASTTGEAFRTALLGEDRANA